MEEYQQRGKLVGQIDAKQVRLDFALVGVAQADDVTISRGGAGVALASNSVALTQGGAVAFVSGGPMAVTQGGGQALVSGGPMTLTQSGGGILVAPEASVERSIVGVLIAGRATFSDVRVLLDTRQAVAMGIAFGLAYALARRWLPRGPRR